MAVTVSPGQEHETQQFTPLMDLIDEWGKDPAKLAGDKGYSARWIRDWLAEKGITPVIAHQKAEKARRGRFDRKSYRRRNVVERCISSLKWFRRVATRYEKLALHYLGMLTLAILYRNL
jgi:transposase